MTTLCSTSAFYRSCRRERRIGPTCQQSRFMFARSFELHKSVAQPGHDLAFRPRIVLRGWFKAACRSTDNATDGPKCRGFLIPLLNPDVPLRPMARLVIGAGLTAKVPEVTGLATDALIAAIDDGRIDAARLGESLRTVWRWEIPK